MTTIIDRILETKRADIAARKACISLADIDAQITLQSKPRGFRAALDAKAANGPALIAEIKKASPSKGLIRENFDPPAHARAYEAGGAACLSVLTDEHWFQGADSYLEAARAATTLPVLRKDFMIDPWQVPESRAIGADAILLIMSAIDDTALAEIEAAALECGMDVLIEVHDARELERAMKLKSRLIGVNNRDLRDFSVDFQRSFDLVAKAPKGCTFVAESGLSTRADLDAMAAKGVRCFLIGEALMRADDIEAATRALIG